MQLKPLQNRQEQQLQKLRNIDHNAYDAYTWYLNNRDKFRGSVWLPAIDVRFFTTYFYWFTETYSFALDARAE